ncbi:unnamed protein product [Rhizoctonia solani]|uniref:DUF6535 domain-containing protein n=1 Tax=Rhizoctonia solani TaxID=456999 RepID=A0A8H3A4R4_9AGAM|nr:unnamed protein product [Rhizoctonia solani]
MSEFIPRPEEPGKRYHGVHDLGRDDPLWPRYVQDAEKWDDGTIKNWNDRMDVLLLFATLFSAIITAFLIEASKNLRPDPSEINTIMLIDIAMTLRALKNESESIIQDPLPTLADYKPNSTNVFVNMLWFLSLCLSIIVALITSLVKQWCNSYISDRIAPPCNQARIRQARFNKLNNWKAVWIVSMLPVLMHVALVLFLIGLIFFLEQLNSHIWKAALSVTVVAATHTTFKS